MQQFNESVQEMVAQKNTASDVLRSVDDKMLLLAKKTELAAVEKSLEKYVHKDAFDTFGSKLTMSAEDAL